METPQDSFRRKNNFMNGKTQNMATSAASDKNTDTDTLQKCWLAEGREPDSRTTVIGPEVWPQFKRGLLQVTDTKNFHVHVGVDDYEAMPFWA